MPGVTSQDQLNDFIRRRHGLKFPDTPTELAVLNDLAFVAIIFQDQKGSSKSEVYLQSDAIRRICLVFSMTEFRARNVDPHGERGPLSPDYLHMLEYEINERKKRKEECQHDDMLRTFIKLMLTARRDYLIDHPEDKTAMPLDMLVRMIHSCLLEFKWRSLKGFNVVIEDEEKWLDFDIELNDAVDTLKRCNEHKWDNNHPVKGLVLHSHGR